MKSFLDRFRERTCYEPALFEECRPVGTAALPYCLVRQNESITNLFSVCKHVRFLAKIDKAFNVRIAGDKYFFYSHYHMVSVQSQGYFSVDVVYFLVDLVRSTYLISELVCHRISV
jgi:hypothetical protein